MDIPFIFLMIDLMAEVYNSDVEEEQLVCTGVLTFLLHFHILRDTGRHL